MERVLAQTYLGNLKEGNLKEAEGLAARVAQAEEGRCYEVEIGRGDRTKGRILTHTKAGKPVGIMKGRDWQLREGDVLESAAGELVIIHLQAQQVMALRFGPDACNQASALVQLGYTLGNQHWPTTVVDGVVYVETVANADVMEKIVNDMAIALNISGLQITFEAKAASEAVEFQHIHQHVGHSH